MKAATIHDLKHELNNKSVKEISELCLRLSRYKKENKELLTYLLFEAENEVEYIQSVKQEITEKFDEIPAYHGFYFKMKMIRKILRITKKHIRYSGIEATEVALLIHFCKSLNELGVKKTESVALTNLYASCVKKISSSIEKLHEDLQFDFREDIESLTAEM